MRSAGFLTNQAYERIKEAIISLEFKPGDRLKERELADRFGISVSPIKNALITLEREGLVENIAYKGATVARIDPGDVQEIFQIREALETVVVSSITGNCSNEDLEELRALLGKMESAYDVDDIESYTAASRDFHGVFIEKFGNQRIISILGTFHAQLERARRTAIYIRENVPLFIEDYRTILKAVEARDPVQAENAMLNHLRRARDAFMRASDWMRPAQRQVRERRSSFTQ